ncbi:MAG: hypothetical protein R3F43_07070 [bacterium]
MPAPRSAGARGLRRAVDAPGEGGRGGGRGGRRAAVDAAVDAALLVDAAVDAAADALVVDAAGVDAGPTLPARRGHGPRAWAAPPTLA